MRVRGQIIVAMFGDAMVELPGGRRRIDVNGGIRQERQLVQKLVAHFDGDLEATATFSSA
jgi:hypothetical protein